MDQKEKAALDALKEAHRAVQRAIAECINAGFSEMTVIDPLNDAQHQISVVVAVVLGAS